jgi:hypothetical protein
LFIAETIFPESDLPMLSRNAPNVEIIPRRAERPCHPT